MPERPERIRIDVELGKRQTPAHGPSQYSRESDGAHVLLLGVGPSPEQIDELLPARKAVYVIEAPDFKRQMPDSWHDALPGHWRFIDPDDLDEFLISGAELWVYRPGIRLFPTFWGPVTGRCRWLATASTAAPAPERTVLFPGTDQDLLGRELADAFAAHGLKVLRFPPKETGTLVPRYLREHKPAFFFCVNFRGLDPHGEIFHLLDAARVPVCVWCVDNPYHLVSNLRSPYWTRTRLAVTDASFQPSLKLHGAERTLHLPLAAAPGLFAPHDDAPDLGLDGRIVFVGRSAFPGKARFFSGLSVPDWQRDAAEKLLDQGGRPDFDWWEKRLDIWPLWPGHDVRRIGLGAETMTREHRAACLMAALETGLTVYGDNDWTSHLPEEADLRPPVDYYGLLPDIYAQAAWTLNVTSLLLPAGLTQRHFDAWTAGGCLVTDDSPGLGIFPDDLAREVAFTHPADIPALTQRLAPGTPLRRDLQAAWHKEITTNHTYHHRTATLLDWLGV